MIVIQEIPWRDPATAFDAWSDDAHLAWLDSAASADPRSRFSYLCVEPFQILEAAGGVVRRDGVAIPGDPFAVLQGELARWPMEPGTGPVPFIGGAVGFLGYELGACLERVPQRHPQDPMIPDMVVGFYDLVFAFDAELRRSWLISSGFPETAPPARQRRAHERAKAALHRMETAPPRAPSPGGEPVRWKADLDRAGYEARIRRILDYIWAGDIFQANFTMRHWAERAAGRAAADDYLRLRALSPAPFAAYLACGPNLAIASASPERFLKLDPAGAVETRPIKGTRPRYADPAADAASARDLAASTKDRAENLMIVDLMRNDLGRVAAIGSVSVPALCAVESFASVHHLVSVVQARLRPGLGPVDLLRATFPGGSITGAPKLRAMEIIDELEVARRGPYCGAIAWFGFDGAMDSSITIRTLVITPERIVAQAGGGIVADSDPADEYEEVRVKLGPLLAAVTLPAGGTGS